MEDNKTFKMYRTGFLSEIKEVECTRLTEFSVYYINARGKEERQLLSTSYYKWHKTKQDAVNFLKSELIVLIDKHEARISTAKEELAQIEAKYSS